MTKRCDNKSVGMLIWKDDKLLLIERRNFPFGFAPPAGHVDGDSSFEISARRELKEEVGLEAKNLTLLIEKRKENICQREGGSWHYWKIYNVEAEGEVNRSKGETKQVGWYDKKSLQALVKRTKKYLKKDISEEEWEANPGLEVVWKEWLEELKIINS